MAYAQIADRPRIPALAIVLLLHAIAIYLLVTGMAANLVRQAAPDLKTFDVVVPAPPAEEPPAPAPDEAAEPDQVVAPPARLPSSASSSAMSASDSRPASGSQLARPASLRSGSFNNERDYPESAKRREEEGTVRVTYQIGVDGRVAGCSVVGSSGSPVLDSTTCRIIQKRFRFDPARDSAGNPIPQTKSQSVRWDLT